MYAQMKHHSLRAVLPWILICLAAGLLLLLFVTQGKALTLLKGPELLDTLPETDLDGAYVTFDKSRLVAVFASAGSEDAEGNEDISEYYYILRYGQDQYVTLISNAKQYDGFSAALTQSENYYTGQSETLASLGTVTGFIEPTDGDTLALMIEQMENLAEDFSDTGLPGLGEGEDVSAQVVSYTVRLGRCGWMPYWLIWTATALWLGLFLTAAVLLLLQLTGWYQKEVRRTLSKDTIHTQAQLEADYQAAQVFASIRLGNLYTWYYKGAKADCFPTGEIAWVYKSMYARASDKYRWGIIVYLKDHTRREMYMPQDGNRSKIIRAYQERGLTFLSTYQSSFEKLFRDDEAAFYALAAQEKADRERKAKERAMWEQV